MENQGAHSSSNSIGNNFEDDIVAWIEKMKIIEDLALNLDSQLDLISNEMQLQQRCQTVLTDNLIENRDDQKILANIQRDHDTESYIDQLENTLELIMQKYRLHTQQKIEDTKMDFKAFTSSTINNCKCTEAVEKQGRVINELIQMMSEYLKDGEELTNGLLEETTKLRTENEILRKMMMPWNDHDEMKESTSSAATAKVRDEFDEYEDIDWI